MRISLEEAQSLIEKSVVPLSPTTLPVKNALGCILAESVSAGKDQPPFPRSPYAGYALRAADSAGASESTPVMLTVVGKALQARPRTCRSGRVRPCTS